MSEFSKCVLEIFEEAEQQFCKDPVGLGCCIHMHAHLKDKMGKLTTGNLQVDVLRIFVAAELLFSNDGCGRGMHGHLLTKIKEEIFTETERAG